MQRFGIGSRKVRHHMPGVPRTGPGSVSARIFLDGPYLPNVPGHGQRDYRPCQKCKGEGRVLHQRTIETKVPAGVEDGTRIRFSGYGEAGAFGGPAGDLYVVFT